jgi:hypothetical protein
MYCHALQGSKQARRGTRQDDGPVGLHHTCTLATLHEQPLHVTERRGLGPHTQVLPPTWQGGEAPPCSDSATRRAGLPQAVHGTRPRPVAKLPVLPPDGGVQCYVE